MYKVVMEHLQTLEKYDFSMDDENEMDNENEEIHMKKATNIIKSYKCNQCDFASSQAGDLRRHLKTHSGEESNKCNQCDYASSQAGDLRTHLKTHTGEKLDKRE